MSVHGVRIGLDGRLEDIVLPDPPALGTALNTAIGSHVFDLVRFEDTLDLFVDDEGLYRSEPNPVLSVVALQLGADQQVLFGAGVFLTGDPDTGESLSLTARHRARIGEAHRFAAAGGRVIVLVRHSRH